MFCWIDHSYCIVEFVLICMQCAFLSCINFVHVCSGVHFVRNRIAVYDFLNSEYVLATVILIPCGIDREFCRLRGHGLQSFIHLQMIVENGKFDLWPLWQALLHAALCLGVRVRSYCLICRLDFTAVLHEHGNGLRWSGYRYSTLDFLCFVHSPFSQAQVENSGFTSLFEVCG